MTIMGTVTVTITAIIERDAGEPPALRREKLQRVVAQ
jgi:hypothetical protein